MAAAIKAIAKDMLNGDDVNNRIVLLARQHKCDVYTVVLAVEEEAFLLEA